jgi:serine/threonine protein kinase
MMSSPSRRPSDFIRRDNRTFRVQGQLRLRGRRYAILDQLGNSHRQRLLIDDPATRQLRVALCLPNDSSTVQHLQVLRRLPQTAELPDILDFERQGDRTIIVLRWIKGIDLGRYLQRVKQEKVVAPSAYESVRLVRGLAHALGQLHRYAQIIHADLKPQNLIITRKPSRLVMIDFGSSWPIEQTRYRSEGDGLSAVYAAPELQTGAARIDPRADQFSATVILYQLLTGTVPFAGLGGQAGRPGYQDEFQGSLELLGENCLCVQWLPTTIRAALDAFLQRGLQLDPDQRYPTTSAWLDAIEDLYLQLKLQQRDPQPAPTRWSHFLDQITDRLFGRTGP